MAEKEKQIWQESLYSCAAQHSRAGSVKALVNAWKEFAFLGGFRDSAARLQECLEELNSRYDKLKREAEEAADIPAVIRAEETLREFAGFSDADETLARLGEKKRQLAAALRGKRRARQRAAAAAVIALIAALALWQGIFRPRAEAGRWHQAESLEAQENYEAALDAYKSLIPGRDGRKAEKAVRRTREKLGYQYIDRKRYEEALELFTEEGLKDGIQAAHGAWGDSLLEEGRFAEAIEQYDKAELQQRSFASYRAWIEELSGKEDYPKALKVLAEMQERSWDEDILAGRGGDAGEAQEMESLKATLVRKRTESAIAAIRDAAREGRGQEALTEFARSQGENLDDLQGQLDFCGELLKLGMDPAGVYPDGVIISDVDLDGYPSGRKLLDQETKAEEGTAGRYLVFRRMAKDAGRSAFLSSELTLSMALTKKSGVQQTELRFLPGDWASLPEELRAQSLEECTRLLLVDSVYDSIGYVMIKTYGSVPSGSTTYKMPNYWYYPLFAATVSAAVFEKDSAALVYLAGLRVSFPEDFQELQWPNMGYAEDDTFVPTKLGRFWGSFDGAYLKEAHEKGVNWIIEQRSQVTGESLLHPGSDAAGQ